MLTTYFSAQVKNFGRSGRTKYTHLVEQDTTSFDSAWAMETAQNAKFFNVQAGGDIDVSGVGVFDLARIMEGEAVKDPASFSQRLTRVMGQAVGGHAED